MLNASSLVAARMASISCVMCAAFVTFASMPSARATPPTTTPPAAIAATKAPALPAAITEALARAQIPIESVGLVVREVSTRDVVPMPVAQHNADRAMNPASVMKLVTTYAGLELLGPAYMWKTEVYVTGEPRGGALTGDLVLKGGGDPKLSVERMWLLLKQLRERGLRTVKGDLIIDKTFFGDVATDPARFDGESMRAYNVGPDAMLVNFKTVRFFFAPAIDNATVSISPDVKPAQLEVVNRTKLIDAPCGDWRERVKMDVQSVTATQIKVTFTGNYPRSYWIIHALWAACLPTCGATWAERGKAR
jgi:serine-type D-Ala-D-Ala carboxypeptidase/endopeptidase (penicillin-binding protein 4)